MNHALAFPSSKSLLLALGLTLAVLLPSCSTEEPKPNQGQAGTPSSTAGSSSGGANTAGSAGTNAGSSSSAGAAGVGGASGSASLGGAGATSGGMSAAGNAGSAASAGGAGANAGGSVSGGVSELPAPPGNSNVPKPAGTAGGLQVLNWAGFKAAVSYTFDDTNSSQISHYQELAALGVRFTFYLITNKTNEINDPVWAQAVKDGHELGNHSKSHAETATGGDIDAATTFIEDKFKVKVWTMAAPYGAAGYIDVAKTRFLINRGVANGLVAPNDNSDPFNLYCYIPPAGASKAAMDAQVTEARTAGKWRIVLVHGFTGGTDGAYQAVAFDQFSGSVAASKALGDVWIDSVVNVGAYWLGQKAFTKAAPAGSAAGTYTWTLPAHFPTGKYLRVNVTGGTLTQQGATLPWNPHGYYEVALDAGSVTLAP